MISYIVMCISVDGTMPLGETLTEKIIDVTLVLPKVYNRVPKMGADELSPCNYYSGAPCAQSAHKCSPLPKKMW